MLQDGCKAIHNTDARQHLAIPLLSHVRGFRLRQMRRQQADFLEVAPSALVLMKALRSPTYQQIVLQAQ